MQKQHHIARENSHMPEGRRIFTFAVIADTHLNQGEVECNSPFDVNRLANGRMRHIVRELNQYDVDFVVHLGDLIHPVPAVENLYLRAARRFKEQVADLKHSIFLLPGNHDVGDKPLGWSPAGEVNAAHLDLWTATFGKHYYAFDHHDCHLVMLNAQIINTGLAAESAQKEWLEKDLAANAGKRIFINIHYPPYVCHPHETEHYDNIGEPGRAWVLRLLERYDVEGLFGGHVHNFWYLRHRHTDCYLLPSTSFVRQDYSAMLKAPPPSVLEAGRNDAAKLGYFIVHVYKSGHACHFIRTYGRLAEPGSEILSAPERVTPLSPRENFRAPLGFDLRESWAETIGIPPSGGLDEFDRKEVRNDYPLLGLWQMGVRKLRVPMQDLQNPATTERMRELTHHGHAFTLFSYGAPHEKDLALIIENQDLLASWEIGFAWSDQAALAPALMDIAQKLPIPLYLSKLWPHSHSKNSTEPYYHVIYHGFRGSEGEEVNIMYRSPGLGDVVSGVVFRVSHQERVWDSIQKAASICGRIGLSASVHLKLTGSNPAEARRNDLWTANRIAEALVAALPHSHLSVFVDTLVDIDRGYFMRNGVLDHLCNPRLGALVLQHLYGALNASRENFTVGECIENDTGTWITCPGERIAHLLYLPHDTARTGELPLPSEWRGNGQSIRKTNLATGEIEKVSTRESVDIHIALGKEEQSPSPHLFTWGIID